MNSPFDIPLSSVALKKLSAETVHVFQGQQGGQGGGGQGNPCENQKPSTWNILYSDTANDFYIISVEEEWGEYRLYQYQGTNPSEKKNQFLQYLRYEAKVASGNMTTSCVNAARENYSMPGGFTKMWPSSGYATQTSAPNGDYTGMWEAWRDAHILAFSGCTDSSASNYNPSALTEDGSCAWTEDTDLSSSFNGYGYKQKSSKSDDEFIWETNATVYRKRNAGTNDNNDGTNFDYYGTIEIVKKCTSKAFCGEPVASPPADRTMPETVIVTYQVGTASTPKDWTGITTDMASQLTDLQSVVNAYKTAYTPICREITNTWDSNYWVPQPCDGAYELTLTETLYSCEYTDSHVKTVYKLLKDGVFQQEWTYTHADGSLHEVLMNTNTGNYPWADMAQNMKDAHEATLDNPPYTQDFAINDGISRPQINSTGVVDYEQRNFILPWGRKTIITNTCDEGRIDNSKSYRSIYPYTAKEGVGSLLGIYPRPSIEEVTDANGNTTLVIKMDGKTLTPSATWEETGLTYDEKDALLEPYLVKLGCMDSTAKNYDPNANNNEQQRAGSGSACVWDCSEGDGRNLNGTCKSCLPEYEMSWNTETKTWNCIDIGGVVDDVIDDVEEATDNTMLIIGGVVGLITLALLGA